MMDKKIGMVVVVLILAVAAWYIISQGGKQWGPSTGPVTVSPTPMAEATIAPLGETGGANMETPDIQTGAPNENLDLGSLV